MPSWIRSPEQEEKFFAEHKERLGITLDKSQMTKNAGRRQLSKLMLNSLWGKFAQRQQHVKDAVFNLNTQSSFDELEDKWDAGLVDFLWRADYRNQSYVVYKEIVEESEENSHYNVAIAAFVTAHARMRLWRELHKLGHRVIYHDTDSIIYERDPNGYNIAEGRYLGEWEDETGGQPITGFVSTGPKTYSYRYWGKPQDLSEPMPDEYRLCAPNKCQKICYSTKAKGFTLNYDATGRINFNSMRNLLVGDVDYLESFGPVFEYNRLRGIITYTGAKRLKWCYNKGIVRNFKVYPTGSDLFPGWDRTGTALRKNTDSEPEQIWDWLRVGGKAKYPTRSSVAGVTTGVGLIDDDSSDDDWVKFG